ncbi:xanthine dehydrogenase accessory protein XdhC [Segniliparus rotundus DSM 44985]|uniref:Xanthine dehydrogenase accessory protein XdhC n=1 Tax=Segniliparus rotundus (strain ATCC BAA-972 / CDC 1076 / CIP 108378 / DSM 44985 / JCM 13578) TaxID=640132 RepID=D6Z7S2_SEGRD|nr:xanthine dehydrogenase accessory protein XdhC [Segniliparus rotundus]ADG98002.1 xanthine dehydrogenase accessory protein XdhC [Segniliparus rotundus DSM 44985]
MSDSSWIGAAALLRDRREPGVLVTLAKVRGHAPRLAGAKMVVSADRLWGSIGGGSLEAAMVERARALIGMAEAQPELVEFSLSDRAVGDHGVQCCGGAATVLVEPLAVPPAVAVFGFGHVGFELARILARHDLDLHVIDSRAEQLDRKRLAVLDDALARIHAHHAPILPETVLDQLPDDCHILIMTHDHAEDAALCDAVLRRDRFSSVGLIGSSAKWARFRKLLVEEGGHTEASISRITTPVGLADITGKEPATIALSIAADLVRVFERRTAAALPPRGATRGITAQHQ